MKTSDEAAISAPSATKIPPASLLSFLLTAVCFAVIAGLGEGLGLLIFQRLNWRAWARSIHISAPILWVSPTVDLCFFLVVALAVLLVRRFVRRTPAFPVLIFLFSFLTAYDWLLTTARLYRFSCFALALGVAAVVVRWAHKHESRALRFFRRSAIWLLASALIVAILVEAAPRIHEPYATDHLPAAPSGSPNVLLIVIDTLRADHLSSYGYPRPTTPNIDQLASHGVLFENAIAPSSWSLPSHASLVTGKPVHEHGWGNAHEPPLFGWRNSALNGLPTLGDALQQHGYRTAAFTANRVYFTREVGLGCGFQHFDSYFDSLPDAFVRTEFGREFARRFLDRTNKSLFTRAFRALGMSSWLDQDAEGSGMSHGATSIRKRADEINRETLAWVEQDSANPFFAMLNYLDVHAPYGGPYGYPSPAWQQGISTNADEYDAGLKYDDDFIGRLLSALDEKGLLRNTIVVITSDHGESLGDHGLTHHGAALYRELVHVPLIISWPGHLPESVRIAQPVSNASIAATVLQLAGAATNSFGLSLSQLWESPASASTWPDPVSELPQTDVIEPEDRALQTKEPLATDGSMRSVTTTQWQLISHSKWGDQLYDWRSDPAELHNLADTPQGRAVRTQILARNR